MSSLPGAAQRTEPIIPRYPGPRGPVTLANGLMTMPGLMVFTRAPRFPLQGELLQQRLKALQQCEM